LPPTRGTPRVGGNLVSWGRDFRHPRDFRGCGLALFVHQSTGEASGTQRMQVLGSWFRVQGYAFWVGGVSDLVKVDVTGQVDRSTRPLRQVLGRAEQIVGHQAVARPRCVPESSNNAGPCSSIFRAELLRPVGPGHQKSGLGSSGVTKLSCCARSNSLVVRALAKPVAHQKGTRPVGVPMSTDGAESCSLFGQSTGTASGTQSNSLFTRAELLWPNGPGAPPLRLASLAQGRQGHHKSGLGFVGVMGLSRRASSNSLFVRALAKPVALGTEVCDDA
jgi:hypothetical protein